MKYRSEIDGLRALAVLPVIFYHTGLEMFSGGYIGVDVFFVISGYLITSLIILQIRRGEFSLMQFYERRARRILPALFVVMFFSIPFAYLLMKPNQLEAFSGSLVAAVLFFSNILFFLESDYFEIASELKPLLHTWSLAVEEQYYLIFPLFLLVTQVGKRLITIIVIVMLLSFALAQFGGNLSTVYPFFEREWSWIDVPAWSFFTTPTRVWELMVGALIGLFLIQRPQLKGVIGELSGFLGVLLIVLAIFIFDDATPYPSVYTLAPVLGAGLIILCATPNNFTGKVLSHRAFVNIGLVSYSAYLWHYPLFAFAGLVTINDPQVKLVEIKILLVGLTFVFAYYTYRFIEKPFRDRGRFTAKQIMLVLTISAAVLISIGLIGKSTKGLLNHQYEMINPTNRYLLIDKDALDSERTAFWSVLRRNQIASPFENDSRINLLILGDSHSEDLTAAFELNPDLFDTDYQVRRLLFDESCLPNLDVNKDKRKCRRLMGNYENSTLPNNADYILLSKSWTDESLKHLFELKAWFGENARKIVIVGRTAEFSDTAFLAMELAKTNDIIRSESADSFLAEHRNLELDLLNEKLKLIAEGLGWLFFDRASLACNENTTTCAFFNSDNEPYYSDYGHWTSAGAKYFGQRMFDSDWLGRRLQQ
jgi:peptidoglycan/LPS O-acetylase OafA/YrhL